MTEQTWSHSRLSTYSMCGKKYELRYVQNVRRVKNSLSLERGSAIHDVARENIQLPETHRTWTAERIASRLQNSVVESDLEKIDIEKEAARIMEAGEALSSKVMMTAAEIFPEGFETNAEENLKFEVKKRNGQVGGLMTTYLDYHIFRGKRHAVIELKTTSRTPSTDKETGEITPSMSHLKQSVIYREALSQNYEIDSLDYRIIYAVMTKEIKYLEIPVKFDDFPFADDVISELWNNIRNVREMAALGSFARCLNMNCDFCEYAALCLKGDETGYVRNEGAAFAAESSRENDRELVI